MSQSPIAERARHWALWLTAHASVTGSDGEKTLPAALAKEVRRTPLLADAEIFEIEAPDDPLGRTALAVFVRGSGDDCVLLTGHFDTVAVDDYGLRAPLAFAPEQLREQIVQDLKDAKGKAERLAHDDLASGEFLPGRGLLDMKSGLAAGLAALEAFAATPNRRGNLLFVAVPDEEVNSHGARALVAAVPDLDARFGIKVSAALNLDCIADRGDGSEGRAIALGSVGKVLLTALVIGRAAHASHPFDGFNSSAL
ncbi:MAG: hypothetical protein RL291_574, partial [Pseudomonadota bacterium]